MKNGRFYASLNVVGGLLLLAAAILNFSNGNAALGIVFLVLTLGAVGMLILITKLGKTL